MGTEIYLIFKCHKIPFFHFFFQQFQNVKTVSSLQDTWKQAASHIWPKGYHLLTPAFDPVRPPNPMSSVDMQIIKWVKQAGQTLGVSGDCSFLREATAQLLTVVATWECGPGIASPARLSEEKLDVQVYIYNLSVSILALDSNFWKEMLSIKTVFISDVARGSPLHCGCLGSQPWLLWGVIFDALKKKTQKTRICLGLTPRNRIEMACSGATVYF